VAKDSANTHLLFLEKNMDPANTFAGLLAGGMLSDLRQDNAVARQGVMAHQQVMSVAMLQYINQMTSMDIVESYAIQGLAASQAPRDAMGLRTAIHIPMADSTLLKSAA
jgi:hypothetical protein